MKPLWLRLHYDDDAHCFSNGSIRRPANAFARRASMWRSSPDR